MKAVMRERYGPPEIIQIVELPVPQPKANEVLVKIHAASVNALDWHMLTADVWPMRLMGEGFLKPKRKYLGGDHAGVVEQVGAQVTQFKPGDEVFGDIAGVSGSFAEYACVPEKLLALKPASLSFAQAAAVPIAGITALQGLRDNGKIAAGQQVLVNGASGGVGTFAVQIAKAYGAEVTAVTSPRNLNQARALGAKHVIDYTQADFTTDGVQYDLILAANGYHSLAEYRRALKPQGRYVMAGGTMGQIFQAVLFGKRYSKAGGVQMGALSAKPSQADLVVLAEMLEAGQVHSVIDRTYPLSQAAEALRYLGTGHASGKVIIQVLD